MKQYILDDLTRRRFLKRTAAAGILLGFENLAPSYAWAAPSESKASNTAKSAADPKVIDGIRNCDLRIGRTTVPFGGRDGSAMTVNGSVPGPLVRLREGERVTFRVTNELDEDTSVHWHGILLPADMDGVPGVSFPGISPGETFTYQFNVTQSGTYWYHSHSGLQEPVGVYGPMIIDPIDPDPFSYDREYVVVLSDWSFEDPYTVLRNLKTISGYYNYQKQTAIELVDNIREKGFGPTLRSRLPWNKSRMDPTDLLDVTAATNIYLTNGLAPAQNWTGLFRPGERIRLRFINAAAMTYFDVRIPGLKMTVVQADGQNIEPIPVDEFRISVAETYDVIVEPRERRAYTVFAETLDRSGYARGTLAPSPGMQGPMPARRKRPVRTMVDMGMEGMASMQGMDAPPDSTMEGMQDGNHASSTPAVWVHGPDRHGPGNTMVAKKAKSRLHEPGIGLGEDGRRVLVYSDLRSAFRREDQRPATREIELHLTGNMERYMWSFDGLKFSEVEGPIPFHYGERLGISFVNDTMMDHPIHLHGMWMELQNGAGLDCPRKHTISIKPAERVSVLISVDAPGDWAFHCHLFYHLAMGMFRVVSVQDGPSEVER